MSAAIQANSLSSLTALASNPPQYPRNPTHRKHEPLVLYIARVPGSRDVFLTPLKPKEKVVSAEDVTSCLYYLHVNKPEDDDLADSMHSADTFDNDHQQNAVPERPAKVIARKPVVQSARPSVDYAPLSPEPPRYPPSMSPTRKPLGARPLEPRTDAQNRYNTNSREPTRDGRSYEGVNQRSPYGFSHRSLDENTSFNSRGNGYDHHKAQSVGYESSTERRGYIEPPLTSPGSQISLTLIRRDPGSGAQWNVAKIRDPSIADTFLEPYARDQIELGKNAAIPIELEVTTPGYSKFLYELDGRPPLISRGTGMSTSSVDSAQSGYQSIRSGGKVFQRQICMEGAKRRSGGLGHRRKSSADSVNWMDIKKPFAEQPGGRRSIDIPAGGGSASLDAYFNNSLATQSDMNLSENGRDKSRPSFRGYAFSSPWHGRCEFTTGAGGGSLKCNHIIPVGVGVSAVPVPQVVSELRFNLPSVFSRSRSPEKESSSMRSLFKPRHSRHNSAVEETVRNPNDPRSRLDLSLGQEQAGGGFGGKHAKLGKLILEDEGLKMMDLLVAANLGLWWRAYERSFR